MFLVDKMQEILFVGFVIEILHDDLSEEELTGVFEIVVHFRVVFDVQRIEKT
jgi:hypothetical protein